MAYDIKLSLNSSVADVSTRAEMRKLAEALVDALEAIAQKLDADAGVTDTDYEATLDGVIIK